MRILFTFLLGCTVICRIERLHCKKWGVRVTPFWGVKQSCTTDTYFWCQNLDTPDGCYEDTHGVLRQHHFVVLR